MLPTFSHFSKQKKQKKKKKKLGSIPNKHPVSNKRSSLKYQK